MLWSEPEVPRQHVPDEAHLEGAELQEAQRQHRERVRGFAKRKAGIALTKEESSKPREKRRCKAYQRILEVDNMLKQTSPDQRLYNYDIPKNPDGSFALRLFCGLV